MNTTNQDIARRRSLRIALLAVIIGVVLIMAIAFGVIIGAARSERVNAWLASLRNAPSIEAREAGYFTCGMHPWVILPEPGLCPVCHMDLTPLDASKLTGELVIDPIVVQNIGVRIAPVTQGALTQRIRTVGTIEYDERSVRDVSTKIAGWIETLHVDSVGAPVDVGDALFEIYSPELFQAQQEYLLALRAKESQGATVGGLDLVESARIRLEYFDISDDQIAQLEASGVPTKTLTIRSPHAGIVIDKNVTEGMRIEPGTRVFRIADLSTVWVMTTLYEHQLPLVDVGQSAVMTLPFLLGRSFEGEVAYIYPYLNERARQARVRIEFVNPDHVLKPGMFANVELTAEPAEDSVLAPREAVITTGQRQIAFVSLGEGRFEPREIRIGLASGGMVQVLEGLDPGEMVVTSGQFLLDSESRMREALAKMVTGDMAADQRPNVIVEDVGIATALPESSRAALADLLEAYLAIGDALAGDTISGVKPRAEQMRELFGAVTAAPPPADAHFWHKHANDVETVTQQTARLASATDIDAARNAYGHLSDALDRIVSATGVPPSLGIEIDRRVCGMAPDVPRDGVWLQRAADAVRNPYFGSMMLRCNVPDEHRRLPVMEVAGEADRAAHSHEEPGQ
jgi:Cu(I)/Ag(I) efflux system membrane fusion protein